MSSRGKRKATSQVKPKDSDEGPSSKRPKPAMAYKKPRRPKGMVEVPEGTILTDLTKKTWKLGRLIGWGGFGALYLASSGSESKVDENAVNVIKIEPHANGPLFTELAFYQRVAKSETINSWKKSQKLKHLGVPVYLGSGSLEHNGAKLRFMAMERFGQDVDQIFLEHDRHFDIKTVLTLGIRIIDILEYIHGNEYAHADIKGSNLMMGYSKLNKNQVYLLDYGLTFRFSPNGKHKEYKEDPKRRHDGTVEFTSRDAHKGVAPSRRSDLEILGYVMLQWLCGRLPWEDKLADKEYVKNQKIKYMDDIPKFMKECLPSGDSSEIQQFLEHVDTLDYDEIPDYSKVRRIFQNGLKKRKISDDGKSVIFTPAGTGKPSSSSAVANGDPKQRDASEKKKTTGRKRALVKAVSESSGEEPPVKIKPTRSRGKATRNASHISESSDEEPVEIKPSRSRGKATRNASHISESSDEESVEIKPSRSRGKATRNASQISESSDEEDIQVKPRRSPKKRPSPHVAKTVTSPRKITRAPAVVSHATSAKQQAKPVRKARGKALTSKPTYVDMATSPIVFK